MKKSDWEPMELILIEVIYTTHSIFIPVLNIIRPYSRLTIRPYSGLTIRPYSSLEYNSALFRIDNSALFQS